MADADHLEILKQGISVWNQWRRENPDIRPDLSGKLDDRLVLSDVLRGSAVWGTQPLLGASPPGLEGKQHGILRGGNFAGADLSYSDARGIDFSDADLSKANLYFSDLRGANFVGTDLRGAVLYDVDLCDARLVGCNLSDADATKAKLYRADFFRSTVTNANFREVEWEHCKIMQRAPNTGLDRLQGEPVLLQYWLHRVYIEALRPKDDLAPKKLLDWFAIHRPIQRMTWLPLPLTIFGGLVASVVSEGDLSPPLSVMIGAIWGLFAGLFFSSYWGRRVRYFVWSLFGYGLSWTAVAVLGFGLIGLFGLLYATVMIPSHVQLISPDIPGANHWFYPWYVAAMGFATLGVTDLVEPVSGLGQIFLVLNVISGFSVFGLLLSVLGNSFIRRP